MYSTKQVGGLFQRSHETIRNWSKEFADYLNPKANPGKGYTRSFTDEDIEVFALVAQMKDNGYMYEEIGASLDKGLRGTPPEFTKHELQDLLTTTTERRLLEQVETLQSDIRRLAEERDKALIEAAEANELRVNVGKLQREVEILNELLERERENDQSDLINQLYQQIGELRGEIKYIRQQLD